MLKSIVIGSAALAAGLAVPGAAAASSPDWTTSVAFTKRLTRPGSTGDSAQPSSSPPIIQLAAYRLKAALAGAAARWLRQP